MSNYDGITEEEFYEKLLEIARDLGVKGLLELPGVYGIVKISLRKDVLEALRPDAGDDDE